MSIYHDIAEEKKTRNDPNFVDTLNYFENSFCVFLTNFSE
jgi:hypothetical protein